MGDEKGMKNVMSAERAQELLAAADTAGRWTLARARDAGTYEVRSDPGDRPVTGWGRVVQYRGDAALMAAAPELAESVVALHNELRIEQVTSDGLREDRDELRAELSAVRAALREALDDPSGQYSADGAELVSLVKLLDARHKAARREEGKATAKVVKVAAERDELRVENERLRGLLDAAPKLMPPADGGPDLLDRVDTIVAMTAEIVRLGAIIEGRTVAPTDHELEVHGARGGRWRTRYQVGDPALCRDGMEATEAREVRDRMRPLHVYTWWATEADGTPCAWPEVSQ